MFHVFKKVYYENIVKYFEEKNNEEVINNAKHYKDTCSLMQSPLSNEAMYVYIAEAIAYYRLEEFKISLNICASLDTELKAIYEKSPENSLIHYYPSSVFITMMQLTCQNYVSLGEIDNAVKYLKELESLKAKFPDVKMILLTQNHDTDEPQVLGNDQVDEEGI